MLDSSNITKMARELCFLTVIGKDRKGIIARISNALYEDGINVEDFDMKVARR